MIDLEDALATLAEPAPATLAPRVAQAVDTQDQYTVVDGPTGPLWISFNRRGISLVEVGDGTAAHRARYPTRSLRPAPAATVPQPLTFDLSSCSTFQQQVLHTTATIPEGEVRSYGWVAREIGHPAAVRAVGTALGRNPIPIFIPCHRVIRTDGHLGNYGLGGTDIKRRLLAHEGVDLDDLDDLATRGIRYVGDPATSVYCLPTCHAHHAAPTSPSGRRTFRTTAEADRAGYQPCPRCRPSTS